MPPANKCLRKCPHKCPPTRSLRTAARLPLLLLTFAYSIGPLVEAGYQFQPPAAALELDPQAHCRAQPDLLPTGASSAASPCNDFDPALEYKLVDDATAVHDPQLPSGASQADTNAKQQPQQCFRAAVFEHNRLERASPEESVEANLDAYAQAARSAAQSGAQVLVFPEDGLFMGLRSEVEPLLEPLLDPETLNHTNRNPCAQPHQFGNKILQRLSCIARENSLYLVANFGSSENCLPNQTYGKQKCPLTGHFALNTDVVLDPQGDYIKRYRKFNTFLEIFDHAPQLEVVHFDTPLGRFGVFTCFDIMFWQPAVQLVEEHKIDTVLFPTWWYDELPLLTAIQFQDAWSETHQVNLLAANMLQPELGSVGSGIFAPKLAHYTSATISSSAEPTMLDSRLLIADIPRRRQDLAASRSVAECAHPKPLLTSVALDDRKPVGPYQYLNYTLLPTDTLQPVVELEANETVCSGRVCCRFDYKITHLELENSLVLIVRDSRRPGAFNWFEQVCALAALEKPLHSQPLNETSFAREPAAHFERLSIEGTFNTPYVYPISSHSVDKLVDRQRRKFNLCSQRQFSTPKREERTCRLDFVAATTTVDSPSGVQGQANQANAIYSFALYGRRYEADKMPEGW